MAALTMFREHAVNEAVRDELRMDWLLPYLNLLQITSCHSHMMGHQYKS